MNTGLRRVGGVVAMGATWAIGWGLGVGGLVELIIDPAGRIADIWPMVLGLPAFVAGVIFALVLLIAEGGRGVGKLSFPRVTAWGAVAGLLLGALLLATPLGSEAPLWTRVAGILVRTVPLGAATGCALLVLTRAFPHQRLLAWQR